MPTERQGGVSLLVFGAGGHGCVVVDAALRSCAWSAVTASDRDPVRCMGELLPGVPLQAASALPVHGLVHVAIGNNTAREKESLVLGVHRLVTVMHPHASVSPHAVVAAGCFIAAQAVLAPGAHLGLGVIVNHGAVVDHDASVGAFAHIAPGAVLGGHARVGARVLVGAGAIVQPGRCVCDDVVVGAGAVVCADVTEAGTYVGVPARRIQ